MHHTSIWKRVQCEVDIGIDNNRLKNRLRKVSKTKTYSKHTRKNSRVNLQQLLVSKYPCKVSTRYKVSVQKFSIYFSFTTIIYFMIYNN